MRARRLAARAMLAAALLAPSGVNAAPVVIQYEIVGETLPGQVFGGAAFSLDATVVADLPTVNATTITGTPVALLANLTVVHSGPGTTFVTSSLPLMTGLATDPSVLGAIFTFLGTGRFVGINLATQYPFTALPSLGVHLGIATSLGATLYGREVSRVPEPSFGSFLLTGIVLLLGVSFIARAGRGRLRSAIARAAPRSSP